ncbi:MAG: DNA adenine methylase, partial [Prolixibacteraceae bacterium]|nr:DNA adenine methylase [Prolixibacteraceae bacterium]
HSRSQFNDAKVVYANPHMFSREKRAWAIWVMANQSFSSMIDGTWGYDISKNCTSKKINNKRNEFSEELAIRLQNVQIECTDALRIINSRDQKDAFFYCDPPYFNSDCGHYDGYSKEDFKALLTLLSSIKGKFLLSSYPSDILSEYTEKHEWYQKQIKQTVSVANNNSTGKPNKSKIEVLTANYDFEALHKPTDLFTDL